MTAHEALTAYATAYPCPGFVVEPGMTSGCDGSSDDCPTCRAVSAEPAADDGLTDEERVVSDALYLAFSMYEQLEQQHYDELRDFADGIHLCQSQLLWRIVRRAHPEAWPIKSADSAPEQEVSDG